jgi:kinesin family protein 2/24
VTAQNATSSRSHAMIKIFVSGGAGGSEGKLILVDLAGTERKEDSMWHTAERRKEGAQINASLYALKECMRAMAESEAKIPFKQCALTRILAESFTHEQACTAVLATVSPGNTDTEHTLHTLHTVTAMCGIDHLTTESRIEVKELPMEADASGNSIPQVDPPNRWSHDRLKEWIETVKGGKFAKFAAVLPSKIDGATIVRQPVGWFTQVLCDKNEKAANALYAALRAEVSNANKAKQERAMQLSGGGGKSDAYRA